MTVSMSQSKYLSAFDRVSRIDGLCLIQNHDLLIVWEAFLSEYLPCIQIYPVSFTQFNFIFGVFDNLSFKSVDKINLGNLS